MTLCQTRKQFGEQMECTPSRFLDELPQADLQWKDERRVMKPTIDKGAGNPGRCSNNSRMMDCKATFLGANKTAPSGAVFAFNVSSANHWLWLIMYSMVPLISSSLQSTGFRGRHRIITVQRGQRVYRYLGRYRRPAQKHHPLWVRLPHRLHDRPCAH